MAILSPILRCLLGQNPGFRSPTKNNASARPIRTFAFSIFSSEVIITQKFCAKPVTEEAVRTSVGENNKRMDWRKAIFGKI